MKLTKDHLLYLTEVAQSAAVKASDLITEYVHTEVKVEKKSAGFSLASQVVTEVDRMSQEVILSTIAPTLLQFDLGLLTEESDDDKSRLKKDYFWCIDPLDGTLCFTEKRPGYSVSLALVSKQGIPQLGVVVNPVDKTIYSSVIGEGVYKNGHKLIIIPKESAQNDFTIICDQGFMKSSMYSDSLHYLKSKIISMGFENIKILQGGGAVMNAISVLENSPSCYFKLPKETIGGGSFWDYASTTCIFNELSMISCDFNSNSLDLNNADSVFMNSNGVIFCSNAKIKDMIVEMKGMLK